MLYLLGRIFRNSQSRTHLIQEIQLSNTTICTKSLNAVNNIKNKNNPSDINVQILNLI